MLLFATLALVTLYLVYELWRALTEGRIGRGKGVRFRTEQPIEFWGQVIFGIVALLAMLVSAASILLTGSPPSIPLISLVVSSWFTIILAWAFSSGRMSIGSVSFSRLDEPREFWLLFGAGALLMVVVWWVNLTRLFDR